MLGLDRSKLVACAVSYGRDGKILAYLCSTLDWINLELYLPLQAIYEATPTGQYIWKGRRCEVFLLRKSSGALISPPFCLDYRRDDFFFQAHFPDSAILTKPSTHPKTILNPYAYR